MVSERGKAAVSRTSTTQSSTNRPGAMQSMRRKALVGVAIGNFVEWYDFAIYAYTAPIIAELFFPTLSPAAALFSTLAIFGVTFLARPLGGLFFGRYGDRVGRRAALSVILLVMGVCTFLIGLLPTYSSIGVLAPILLTVLRLGQGFSGGGESSGGATFLSEYAPEGQRGRWAGLSNSTQTLPFAFTAVLVLVLQNWLGHDAYLEWGWRVPFLVAGPLALVGLYIRLRLEDTPAFTQHAEQHAEQGAPKAPPLGRVLVRYRRELLLLVGIAALNAVAFYTMSSYFSIYLTGVIGLSSTIALTSNSIALVFYALIIPFAGMLGDAFGRKRVITTGAVVLAVVTVPGYLLAGSGGLPAAIAGQMLITAGLALVSSVVAVAQAELFPVTVRYTCAALGYNVAYAAFGGTAPFIDQFLASSTGEAISPAFYLVAMALLALLPIRALPETSRASMHRTDNATLRSR